MPVEPPPPPLEWFFDAGFDPAAAVVLPGEPEVLPVRVPPGVVVPVVDDGGRVVGVPAGPDGGLEPSLWLPVLLPGPPPEPVLSPPGGVVEGGRVDGGAVLGGVDPPGDFAGGVELPGEWVLTPSEPPPPGDVPGEVVCVVVTGFVVPLWTPPKPDVPGAPEPVFVPGDPGGFDPPPPEVPVVPVRDPVVPGEPDEPARWVPPLLPGAPEPPLSPPGEVWEMPDPPTQTRFGGLWQGATVEAAAGFTLRNAATGRTPPVTSRAAKTTCRVGPTHLRSANNQLTRTAAPPDRSTRPGATRSGGSWLGPVEVLSAVRASARTETVRSSRAQLAGV